MVATKLVTVEDLEIHGVGGDHSELVDGVLIEMSPANENHGLIAIALIEFLAPYVRKRQLGKLYTAEVGFVLALGPDTVLAPDVAFVSAKRLDPNRRRDRFLRVAPDLAIEVESPSDSIAELRRKAARYVAAGTSVVWLIRPMHRTIVVITADGSETMLTEMDELDGGSVVPGFSLSIAELFDELD